MPRSTSRAARVASEMSTGPRAGNLRRRTLLARPFLRAGAWRQWASAARRCPCLGRG